VKAGQVAHADLTTTKTSLNASELDRAVVARELQKKRKADAMTATQSSGSQIYASQPSSSLHHSSQQMPPSSSPPIPSSSQSLSRAASASHFGLPGPSQGDVIEIDDDEDVDNLALSEDINELYCQMRTNVVGIQYYNGTSSAFNEMARD
jgi:hypothetical protein